MTTRIEIATSSADETRRVGETLGRAARPGDLVLLFGELGAGKTTLTQGILRGLGGEEYARSPTFVLVSQYEARLTLYHVDLYRLDEPDDTYELGLEEILDGDGLCVVEWADRALGQFPTERLTVEMLRTGEGTRRLALQASGTRYERYVREVKAIFMIHREQDNRSSVHAPGQGR